MPSLLQVRKINFLKHISFSGNGCSLLSKNETILAWLKSPYLIPPEERPVPMYLYILYIAFKNRCRHSQQCDRCKDVVIFLPPSLQAKYCVRVQGKELCVCARGVVDVFISQFITGSIFIHLSKCWNRAADIRMSRPVCSRNCQVYGCMCCGWVGEFW
jgi:hypothetical protein